MRPLRPTIATVLTLMAAVASGQGVPETGPLCGDEDRSGPAFDRGEDLAESAIGLWQAASADTGPVENSVTEDRHRVHAGRSSVRLLTTSGSPVALAFPRSRNACWNLAETEALSLSVFPENEHTFQEPSPEIRLGRTGGGAFVYRPAADILTPARGRWVDIRVPLPGGDGWTRIREGNVSLDHIDYLEIRADTWDTGFSIWVDGVRFVPDLPRFSLPAVEAPDLDVLYIERLPHYPRYDVAYDDGVPRVTNPDARHGPQPGETVTWRAFVGNRGGRQSRRAAYRWLVDGAEADRGSLPRLAPGAQAAGDLRWEWQEGPHWVAIEVDTEGDVAEWTAANNRLAVRTDALTYGFWVEEGTRARLDRTFNALGSHSCEDWLRSATVDVLNEMFAQATFDFAPSGVEQRVRIDRITYVPDGTLASFGGTHAPTDLDVDGVWGFQAGGAAEYVQFATLVDSPLIHELLHQLGLIDLYRMDLPADRNEVDGRAYGWPRPGIMGGGDRGERTGIDLADHDVYGLNSTRGFRRGHYGEYLFSVPRVVRVRALGAGGRPLPGARLRFFQRSEDGLLDAQAEIEGTADPEGLFVLPNRPAPEVRTVTGHRLVPNPFGQIDVVGQNGTFLVEVTTAAGTHRLPLRITDLNLAWWRGEREVATIDLPTELP